jgi:hypothetical protein
VKKSTKYTEKYWFALGYFHKRINDIQVPSEAMIGAYSEYFNVDILKEYELGIESAEKDIASGI